MVDEYVVFCAPTGLQQRVYKALLESRGLQRCLYEGDAQSHLKAITLMRKICNAVSLVVSKAEKVCLDYLYLRLGRRPALLMLEASCSGRIHFTEIRFGETRCPRKSFAAPPQHNIRESRPRVKFHIHTQRSPESPLLPELHLVSIRR